MENDKLDPIAEIAAAVEKNRRGRDRDESRGRGGRYSTQTATTTPALTSWYVALICPHCEGNHVGDRCPYIKAIEYDDAGKVRRIEFYPRPVKLSPPVVTVSWSGSTDVATWSPAALRTYGCG